MASRMGRRGKAVVDMARDDGAVVAAERYMVRRIGAVPVRIEEQRGKRLVRDGAAAAQCSDRDEKPGWRRDGARRRSGEDKR